MARLADSACAYSHADRISVAVGSLRSAMTRASRVSWNVLASKLGIGPF